MPKLTKRVIDGLSPDPNGGELFVWDSELRGFGVRVMPTGGASFLIQYRTLQGRTRRHAIGRVGTLTPEEARGSAREKLAAVARGEDPSAQRQAARADLTIAELAALYMEEGPADKPNKKQRSWDTDRSNINRHILPLLGGKLAKAITAADVARWQRDVAAGKTARDEKTGFRGRAIVEGGKGIAARSLAVVGAMMTFGVKHGVIAANPAIGVKAFKGEKKERFLTEGEVTALAEGLTILEELHMVHRTIGDAIRLLTLSGCRKNEIAGLKWSWVDFGRGCLRLPDSKTGAKVVPLAAPAMKVLADRPRGESEFVFPRIREARGPADETATGDSNAVDGHVVGLQKAWEMLRVWCGLEDVRIHDLRHSFASFAAADGASLFLIGKVLGHAQSRTTERYAHLADDPLKAVAELAAGRIAAAMAIGENGGEDRPSAEVVPMRRA